jgi:hypothetical protein
VWKEQKLLYITKMGAHFLWNEFVESFSFLLWLSTPPSTVKIVESCFEDTFCFHQIRVNLNRLYRKEFIFKIKKEKNVFFKFKKSPKYLFWT